MNDHKTAWEILSSHWNAKHNERGELIIGTLPTDMLEAQRDLILMYQSDPRLDPVSRARGELTLKAIAEALKTGGPVDGTFLCRMGGAYSEE